MSTSMKVLLLVELARLMALQQVGMSYRCIIPIKDEHLDA